VRTRMGDYATGELSAAMSRRPLGVVSFGPSTQGLRAPQFRQFCSSVPIATSTCPEEAGNGQPLQRRGRSQSFLRARATHSAAAAHGTARATR
jgi:hypothetical protein